MDAMVEPVAEQEGAGEEVPKNIPIPDNVDENESVIVSCGEIQGTFLVHKLKVIYDGGSPQNTHPEFELSQAGEDCFVMHWLTASGAESATEP